MEPPPRVRLSPGQVATLDQHYRRTPKPAEWTRLHIILLSHQGYIPPAIATIVRVDPATGRRAIHRFKRHGLLGLLNAPRPGRPRKVTPAWEELLVHTVEQDPRRVGVLRAAWTAPALATYLAERTGIRVSAQRIRHYLRQHGYAPRRPTWTVRHLARRDPQYAAKGPAPRRSNSARRLGQICTSRMKRSWPCCPP
jgi:transposase